MIRRLLILILLAAMCFGGCGDSNSVAGNAVSAAENAVGWAVGDSVGVSNNGDEFGTILYTSSGGKTWVRQGSPEQIPDVGLTSVSAIDANNAWAVGSQSDHYGTILRTTDGGKTWVRQGSNEDIPNVSLLSVSAVDNNTAWVVGMGGTILHTTDGGKSWMQQTSSDVPNVDLEGVVAVDAKTVWAVGNVDKCYGTILHTTDGGTTWGRQESLSTIPNVSIINIDAVDSNTAWAVGHGFMFLHTKDSGKFWENQSFEAIPDDANDVCGVYIDTAWVVTDMDGIYYYNKKHGAEWIQQTSPAHGFHMLGVSALDANTAWAVGRDLYGEGRGVILHTSDGSTWQKQEMPVQIGLWRVSFVQS